jgi:hypothetical protein
LFGVWVHHPETAASKQAISRLKYQTTMIVGQFRHPQAIPSPLLEE